ncbi:hypothetical protein BT63DRAFT_444716 [Microthyrium microscopicum]|uniref:Uncharacterized protein n=1 Tax=Microthyrium microscopicum TaxID=703497 RepID=A0A6A6TUM8_9PEZI|nr:hypothetical protein BT63DRAFT_444716 [Microthyrium microscopicum]
MASGEGQSSERDFGATGREKRKENGWMDDRDGRMKDQMSQLEPVGTSWNHLGRDPGSKPTAGRNFGTINNQDGLHRIENLRLGTAKTFQQPASVESGTNINMRPHVEPHEQSSKRELHPRPWLYRQHQDQMRLPCHQWLIDSSARLEPPILLHPSTQDAACISNQQLVPLKAMQLHSLDQANLPAVKPSLIFINKPDSNSFSSKIRSGSAHSSSALLPVI